MTKNELEGAEITCPICGLHKNTVHINKRGRPYVICTVYGGSFNYNTPQGEEFIIDKIESEKSMFKF